MTNVDKNGHFLRVISAVKKYDGVMALENVDFDLYSGEVHALVGENGAGKSTLCKGIAGTTRLTSGTIILQNKEMHFSSPADALAAGISMVYQETSLVPTMTVAQNLFLGQEAFINSITGRAIDAQQLLRSLSFPVDAKEYVANIGAAQRQMVEIARAVLNEAKIIIFDEPTAALTPEEKSYFFDLIHTLQNKGVSIIFISHMLEEALNHSNRITVLRDGKHVMTGPTSEMTRDKLVQNMVGHLISDNFKRKPAEGNCNKSQEKNKLLSVENVSRGNIVKNMSFSVYTGEVTCMAGLVGSGRTDIAKIIFGASKRDWLHGGKIFFKGKAVRYRVPSQAINDGIVYITEDRKVDGFFPTKDSSNNIYLGKQNRSQLKTVLISNHDRDQTSSVWSKRLKIKALSKKANVNTLSGGNQQKVVLAKSLVQEPELIIIDEPTRGVDVGAIEDIHQFIRSLAEDGKAVLVISSYLPEVLKISDRILVTRAGRIVAEFDVDEANEEKIMYAAIH